jgi:hypothetical protein
MAGPARPRRRGTLAGVADLTPKEEAELRRLVDAEHVPEDQAREIVTERRLDVVIDGSGPLGPVPALLDE